MLEQNAMNKHCVKFQYPSHHCCREINFSSKLDLQFDKVDGSSYDACLKSMSRTITMEGFSLLEYKFLSYNLII